MPGRASAETGRAGLAPAGRLRRGLTFGAGALLIFGAVDIAFLGWRSWVALAIRVAWAGCALLAARGLESRDRRARSAWLSLLTLASPLFFAGLVHELGGVHSVPFTFFLSLPLALAVLIHEGVTPIVVGSISNTVAALAFLAWSGESLAVGVQWGGSLVATGLLAIYASWLHERIAQREVAANTARLEAQARLAESELSRVQAERATLVNQLIAGVAHEVNNPLGIILANLDHLRHFVADRGLTEEAELREVVRDATEGALRIAAVVKKLKSLSRVSPALAPCQLSAAVTAALRRLVVPPGITVHDDLPASLPLVIAAAEALPGVVSQMLLSALGGFGDANSARGNLWLAARSEGLGVTLTIEDDGPLPWEPTSAAATGSLANTYRGKDSGLGLGLAGEYATQWGGGLSVARRLAGGTRVELRFTTTLPSPT